MTFDVFGTIFNGIRHMYIYIMQNDQRIVYLKIHGLNHRFTVISESGKI